MVWCFFAGLTKCVKGSGESKMDHMDEHHMKALDGFVLVVNTDGRVIYASDNIVTFLGHPQVTLALYPSSSTSSSPSTSSVPPPVHWCRWVRVVFYLGLHLVRFVLLSFFVFFLFFFLSLSLEFGCLFSGRHTNWWDIFLLSYSVFFLFFRLSHSPFSHFFFF